MTARPCPGRDLLGYDCSVPTQTSTLTLPLLRSGLAPMLARSKLITAIHALIRGDR